MINRIFFIAIGLIVMMYIYIKVNRNKISEKESIFWMIGAVAIFILSLFPQIIQVLAKISGIEYAPSMLFLLGIIFCIILIFRLTVCVFALQQQVKELAQRNALIEGQINKKEDEKILHNSNMRFEK